MTQHTLTIGPLSLLAEQHGPLLTITIHAPSDSAPVGKMTLTVSEWTALVALVDSLAVADKRHAEDRAEIERLTKENAALRLSERDLVTMPGSALEQHKADLLSILRERDEYHEMLRTILAACDDSTRASIGKDAPLRAVRKVIAERDSLRQQVRELTEERDAYRRAKQENDERLMIERDQARSDLSAALASVDAMAERIEQMRPVYEACIHHGRAVCTCSADVGHTDGCAKGDAWVAMWTAIDTALAHTAREQAKEKSNG